MGFRFYRRLKILPGLSLNLSGSGLSASFGPRGAKLTVGPRGVWSSLGVPGTGLSYRQKLNSPDGTPTTRRPTPPALDPSKLTPEALEIMQAVVDGKDGVTKSLNTGAEVLAYWDKVKSLPGAYMVNPKTGRRMTVSQIEAFAKSVDRETALKKLSEEIAQEEEKLREIVTYWHPLPPIPDWQSYVDNYEQLTNAPFPEPMPMPPSPPMESQAWAELLEKTGATEGSPGLLGRIFPNWAQDRAKKEAEKLWPSHWAELESNYQSAVQRYETEVKERAERENEWRNRCHQEAQELYALMSGENKEALLASACAAIHEISLPFEADAHVMLNDDTDIFVNIDLPEIENVLPPTKREVSLSGTIKQGKRPEKDMNEPYTELVLGHSLNLVAKLFIELPRLQEATLAAYTRRANGDEYVLEATATRENITAISTRSPGTLMELISSLALTNAIYELDADSQLRAIKAPDWTKQVDHA